MDDIRIADALASHRVGERGGVVAFSCAHCDEISLRFAAHEGLTGWKDRSKEHRKIKSFQYTFRDTRRPI